MTLASTPESGDSRRRVFLVPRTQVHRLNLTGASVSSIDMSGAGMRQQLQLAPGCAVILANGTIKATLLALESLGIASLQFGSPHCARSSRSCSMQAGIR
jgi:hypothetical protein